MQQSLDDIIFENRNKSYGAYLLRTLYEKHLFTGLAIACGLSIVALTTPLVINTIFPKKEVRMEMITVDVLPPVESIDPNTPPPPPMPKIEVPKVDQIKFVPVEITKEDIKQEQVATQEELKEPVIGSETVKGDTTATENTVQNNFPGDPTGTSEQPFMNVSHGAEPGYNASEYLRKNTRYPTSERLAGNEATISVFYRVSKEGKIFDVRAAKGFSKAFEEEAIRVVQSMPDWKPAMQNGHAIPTTPKKIDIKFKLEDFEE
jgi:periplasmic protein TonB